MSVSQSNIWNENIVCLQNVLPQVQSRTWTFSFFFSPHAFEYTFFFFLINHFYSFINGMGIFFIYYVYRFHTDSPLTIVLSCRERCNNSFLIIAYCMKGCRRSQKFHGALFVAKIEFIITYNNYNKLINNLKKI